MVELYLDLHANHCPDNSKNEKTQWANVCTLNPNRFLFFLGTKFILITYNSCMNSGDKYDFRATLIDTLIKRDRIFDVYEVNRGVNVKDIRTIKQKLEKYGKDIVVEDIEQINFIYQDNAGKKYAITTTAKYSDAICNQKEIDENYKAAKEMLEKNKYEWLLEPLEELYNANKIYE